MKIAIGVLAIIVLIIGSRFLPVNEWLESFNVWLESLGWAGWFIYILVYIAATVLFLPGSVITLAAGFLFGVVWGTAAVSIGSVVGASLAFLISRHLARDQFAAKLESNAKFKSIDKAIGKQGGKIVFLLRLSPVIPFNISNYLYGLTAVKFWHYVLASWIGMLPGTILYVYLGAIGKAGLEAATGEDTGTTTGQYIIYAIGLIATIVATIYITKIARKALNETEVDTPEAS
ncbi:TVP38/TMEM64 family protein [Rubellicoccus peritrichatus]|uniref:TVP38/TMEM64 family membrane protein n=1 Tax=Rubellicoccus peritrichatus TaxID=3080537 RepID=A0AAQ3LDW6_9BACT|nr:TVP38/TMEM64 family protein [Puniceicoccus sp. CR14]WOO42802.1 TVP38/TMEM64 family protein [Puniceicoccus sp. CR14]